MHTHKSKGATPTPAPTRFCPHAMPPMASNAAPEIHREDLQAAISKAAELRTLHAALLQTTTSFQPGASPSLTRLSTQLSGEEYPVFTPSYDEQPPLYRLCRSENRAPPQTWNSAAIVEEADHLHHEDDELNHNLNLDALMRRLTRHKSPSLQRDLHFDDQRSTASSRLNHITLLHSSSPTTDSLRRTHSEDLRSVVSRTRNPLRTNHQTQPIIPESHNRTNTIISWLLPRLKKKPITNLDHEDWTDLRKELVLANENRDAAMRQAGETKAAMEELREKLRYLETYCDGLKKALKQQQQQHQQLARPTKPSRSICTTLPVSHEAMVEGFLQVVSESRLSVWQFCRSLLMEEGSRRSELYRVEAKVNRCLYQDFENRAFRRDGPSRELDPAREREGNFAAFVGLRKLSWSEVVRKGTRYYSEEFSGYCDARMAKVVGALGVGGDWKEEVLQGFFVAVKCVWLLHLLAWSLENGVGIMRVEEGRGFDGGFMEDVMGRGEPHRGAVVKEMVSPGFYVEDKVLKCKVLCNARLSRA